MNYYTRNVIDDVVDFQDKKYFKSWFKIVKPILESDEFQRRKLFLHHTSNVYNHVLRVSYKSYVIACKMKLDSKTCAIAGILHDFYPYPYKYNEELYNLYPKYYIHYKEHKTLFKMHGFTHALAAGENSKKYFPELIDDKIYSCILTHMFPLNISLPKYKEAWIITTVDKIDSIDTLKEIKYVPVIIYKKIKSYI